MAITEVYVNPSLNSDTGDGTTDGTAYGDLEYAIEQTTFDTTNGTRVNIKDQGTETLAAELATAMADTVTTAAWAPAAGAECVFQGYSSTPGDGGIADISGGGSVAIINSTALDYVHFIDCHLHNTGSNVIVNLDQTCGLLRCELDNSALAGFVIEMAASSYIIDCYIHNVAGRPRINGGMFVYGNYFENGTNIFQAAMELSGSQNVVMRNIIHLSGTTPASDGIRAAARGNVIMNNSIWSNGGAGSGIVVSSTAGAQNIIANNIIEGFSNTGGFGIEFSGTDGNISYGSNSVYNCATAYDTESGPVLGTLTANETLITASPFTSASTGDFSPDATAQPTIKESSEPNNFYGQ